MQRGALNPSSAIAWGCRRICKVFYSEEAVRVGAWNQAAASKKKKKKQERKGERGDIRIESPVLNQVDGCADLEN